MVSCRIEKITFFILLLCLMELSFCQAQIGFQVSPSRLFFSQGSSAEQTLRLHLNNPMDTRLVLQITCADWRRDSTGEKVYYPSGTLPTSSCPFVRVTPGVVELAPKETRDVLVTLALNQQDYSKDVRNGMIFLTQSNEQEVARAKASSQFIVKAQIGVHVYIVPDENTRSGIDIMDMDIAKTGPQYRVKVGIQNSGNTLMESKLRLEYLNLETMEELKTEAVPVNTMPKDSYRVVAGVPPTLRAGKYLIVAVLDSGPGQTLKVAELKADLK